MQYPVMPWIIADYTSQTLGTVLDIAVQCYMVVNYMQTDNRKLLHSNW